MGGGFVAAAGEVQPDQAARVEHPQGIHPLGRHVHPAVGGGGAHEEQLLGLEEGDVVGGEGAGGLAHGCGARGGGAWSWRSSCRSTTQRKAEPSAPAAVIRAATEGSNRSFRPSGGRSGCCRKRVSVTITAGTRCGWPVESPWPAPASFPATPACAGPPAAGRGRAGSRLVEVALHEGSHPEQHHHLGPLIEGGGLQADRADQEIAPFIRCEGCAAAFLGDHEVVVEGLGAELVERVHLAGGRWCAGHAKTSSCSRDAACLRRRSKQAKVSG